MMQRKEKVRTTLEYTSLQPFHSFKEVYDFHQKFPITFVLWGIFY